VPLILCTAPIYFSLSLFVHYVEVGHLYRHSHIADLKKLPPSLGESIVSVGAGAVGVGVASGDEVQAARITVASTISRINQYLPVLRNRPFISAS